MHGCGPQPTEGARHLKELGFEAVVGGEETVQAALEQGLQAYLCSGAYRGPAFTGEEWLGPPAEMVFLYLPHAKRGTCL